MHRGTSRGFTLIELMITIAVIAIALVLATPSFTRLLADNRETSAVNSLLNSMAYARNTALRTGQTVTVCPVANTTSTTCASNWNAGWSVISAPAGGSSVVLASSTLGAYGVSMSASGTGTPLVFTPRGLVTGLPGTGTELFTFCDKRGATYAQSMVVNTAGYIQTSQTPGKDPDGTALACP